MRGTSEGCRQGCHQVVIKVVLNVMRTKNVAPQAKVRCTRQWSGTWQLFCWSGSTFARIRWEMSVFLCFYLSYAIFLFLNFTSGLCAIVQRMQRTHIFTRPSLILSLFQKVTNFDIFLTFSTQNPWLLSESLKGSNIQSQCKTSLYIAQNNPEAQAEHSKRPSMKSKLETWHLTNDFTQYRSISPWSCLLHYQLNIF